MIEAFTPSEALAWTAVVSLALSMLFGAFSLGGSIWKFFVAAFGWGVVTFAVLGAILLTTPKWTELLVKWGDFEFRVTELEQQLQKEIQTVASQTTQIAMLTDQNRTLTADVTQLASLEEEHNANESEVAQLRAQVAALKEQKSEYAAMLETTRTEAARLATGTWAALAANRNTIYADDMKAWQPATTPMVESVISETVPDAQLPVGSVEKFIAALNEKDFKIVAPVKDGHLAYYNSAWLWKRPLDWAYVGQSGVNNTIMDSIVGGGFNTATGGEAGFAN